MRKGRIEAFSDGVLAIIITIMVLELKVPHEATLEALRELLPVGLSYVLSFINVGIYWNNHHHLFQATRRINGAVMWANLHLLFWLSLFPFCTAWMGENNFAFLPTAVYGVVLVMAAGAYTILQTTILSIEGGNSAIRQAIGADLKGKISLALYAVSIPIAFWQPWISGLLFVTVAIIWFIPDRRLEGALLQGHED
jgi:uncharacterized membrane protein